MEKKMKKEDYQYHSTIRVELIWYGKKHTWQLPSKAVPQDIPIYPETTTQLKWRGHHKVT